MIKYLVLPLLCVMTSPYFVGSFRYPKMVVFDLDRTLWPYMIDKYMHRNVDPPFHKNKYDHIFDKRGRLIKPYQESVRIMKLIKNNNISMSAVSITREMLATRQLIGLLNWDQYFVNHQLNPGNTSMHILDISEECNVAIEDMLFFDDDRNSIAQAERMGIVSIHVRNGMTMRLLLDGLQRYSDIRESHTTPLTSKKYLYTPRYKPRY